MKVAGFIGLVFGLMVASGAQAQNITVKGMGANQCSEVTGLWDRSSQDLRGVMESAIHQWAFGYFSGLNRDQPPANRRNLSGLTTGGTASVIIDVCRRAPNSRLFQVADAFYNQLPYIGAGA